jgi:tetratricopeptide (TPR) repeat protein
VGHALAGQALLWLDRLDEAKIALDAAQKELETIPSVTVGLDPSRSAVQPWVDALRGELLLREGKSEEGRAVLKEVVKALRTAPGPDAWSQGLFRLETLARGAMAVGDWELAEFLATQMVEHDAAYGGSHFTLARVLQKLGDAAGAAREMEAARRYWRDADRDLPELETMGGRR